MKTTSDSWQAVRLVAGFALLAASAKIGAVSSIRIVDHFPRGTYSCYHAWETIRNILAEHQAELMERWNEFFGR